MTFDDERKFEEAVVAQLMEYGWEKHYNQHTTLFNRLENSRGEIHIMYFYKSAAVEQRCYKSAYTKAGSDIESRSCLIFLSRFLYTFRDKLAQKNESKPAKVCSHH